MQLTSGRRGHSNRGCAPCGSGGAGLWWLRCRWQLIPKALGSRKKERAMRLHIIVMTALVLFTALAYGQDDPASRLHAARSLKCHFGLGTSTGWTGGKPKISSARFDQDIQFDSIDLKNQTARVIGNSGASDIRVLLTEVGISFLESAPAVLDITTVFAAYGVDHNFIAVDTRHAFLFGTTMAEQYYGTCKIWQ